MLSGIRGDAMIGQLNNSYREGEKDRARAVIDFFFFLKRSHISQGGGCSVDFAAWTTSRFCLCSDMTSEGGCCCLDPSRSQSGWSEVGDV